MIRLRRRVKARRSASAKEGQGSSKQADKEKRPRERKRDAAAVEVPTDVLHPELYNRLVAWRNAEASALGLPVYTVIQQKAILGISNLLPSDKAMLVRIPYFGKKGGEIWRCDSGDGTCVSQRERTGRAGVAIVESPAIRTCIIYHPNISFIPSSSVYG